MYPVSSFKSPHEVIFAEIIFSGKGFHGQIGGKIPVDVGEKLINLGVGGVGFSVVDVLLFQKNAVEVNHELVKQGGAQKLVSKASACRERSSS